MVTVDPEIALLWLLRLGEMHVEELAKRERVTPQFIIAACKEYGWQPPTRSCVFRPDLHEKLVMWNHGLSWREVAAETRWGGYVENMAREVRDFARFNRIPIREAKVGRRRAW